MSLILMLCYQTQINWKYVILKIIEQSLHLAIRFIGIVDRVEFMQGEGPGSFMDFYQFFIDQSHLKSVGLQLSPCKTVIIVHVHIHAHKFCHQSTENFQHTPFLRKQTYIFFDSYNLMIKLILIIILTILELQTKLVHEVIVIGAGLAGIGASKILTDKEIPHLMIQARDRIGGRVTDIKFQGATVQLGGLLLHSPKKEHPILEIMKKQLNWSTIHSGYSEKQGYYYQKQGQIQDEHIEVMEKLQKQIILEMLARSKLASKDMSVQKAAQYYYKGRLKNKPQIVKDLVNWMVEEYGNIEGSDIGKLSARMIQFDQTPDDLFPEGGYAELVRGIFQRLCKTELRLSEKVVEIDYSAEQVKVVTNKEIHYAKRVISSLPLGVLQHRQVTFIPQLPIKYLHSIDLLDSGVHEKVILSFQQPFWNPDHTWLSFVRKDMKKSMYQMAHVVPSNQNKYVLMLFISGDDGRALLNFTHQELIQNLTDFFRLFSKQTPVIKQVYRTNWRGDQYTRGAYTSFPVGVDRSVIEVFEKPIDGKVWIVGEHTHPKLKSLTHGAFLTGMRAAEQISSILQS